ncbi:MAG: hypothetical protein U5K77_02550 [Candidatus Saccharibacteria bacterium]|nr:hypothetical protein [Candidatus Saccharibacteria bacterium]
MQELIEDLRAALDQMNRSLNTIAENTEKTNQLLETLAKDKE